REQRHPAVVGRLAGLDTEPLLEMRDDSGRARQMTGEVMAHRHDMAPGPLAEVERGKGDDLVHVGRREVEEPGYVRLGLERDVAERLLRHMEPGQERARGVGIERLQAPALGQLRVRDLRCSWDAVAHRSSSPPIMLTDPNVGTRSATISPLIIWCSA